MSTTREELAKRQYTYQETQAGVDMYTRPAEEPDGVIWPDLFVDERAGTVVVKSKVNGGEDQYDIPFILSTIPEVQ